MIIGNNNNINTNSNFIKNNHPNENNNSVTKTNPLIDSNSARVHTDVMSKNAMADKSFAMLQERYEKGLISIEEFTKQCNKLNKLRNKQ